jgi:hypothetical protein
MSKTVTFDREAKSGSVLCSPQKNFAGHSRAPRVAGRESGFGLLACAVLVVLTACNLAPIAPATATAPGSPTVQTGPTVDPLPVPSEYLTNAAVVSYDPLDNMDNWLSHAETGTLADGVFQLNGTPSWQSNVSFKQQFNEGEGLVVKFKVQQANARSELVFVSGAWLTDGFRQFGIYNGANPTADLFQGTSDLGGQPLVSNLTIQPGTWYEALLAIGHGGHLLGVVWDPNNVSQRTVNNSNLGADWTGRSWTFLPKVNVGETLYLDDFYKLSFGDIK